MIAISDLVFEIVESKMTENSDNEIKVEPVDADEESNEADEQVLPYYTWRPYGLVISPIPAPENDYEEWVDQSVESKEKAKNQIHVEPLDCNE